MITSGILAAVQKGQLTDEELKIAIKHYSTLASLLCPHGEKYALVRRDILKELDRLNDYKQSREE